MKQITPKHQAKQQTIANLALIEKQNIVPFTCCLVYFKYTTCKYCLSYVARNAKPNIQQPNSLILQDVYSETNYTKTSGKTTKNCQSCAYWKTEYRTFYLLFSCNRYVVENQYKIKYHKFEINLSWLRMCSEVRRIYENCAHKCARPQFHATLKIFFFTTYCTH